MQRLALLALLVACSGEGAQRPRTQVSDPGELLFNGYAEPGIKCFECHNGDGAGTKWAPALATRVPYLSDDALRRVILDGKHKMPPHRGKLNDAELGQLVAWLRGHFLAT